VTGGRFLRRGALAAVRAAARLLKHDLVHSDFYSPLPDIPTDEALWTRPVVSLAGVPLDTTAQLRFLEATLAPYLAEFDRPDGPLGGRFRMWNGYYQSVDAEVLYAMIRHLKPRRVLEIGSGHSTFVTRAACARNAAEGSPADLVAVDPEPREDLGPDVRLERVAAQELPLERFLALEPGDVLFVDSSHTVKLGSEVNFLVLEVLPRLRPGVVVHFHDIFLPYEYPRAWYLRGTFLAEQYLLHAFLIGNDDYEILFAAHAVARADRVRLAGVIPSLRARDDHEPAAFWLRRRAA
jgi:hypothetical protein